MPPDSSPSSSPGDISSSRRSISSPASSPEFEFWRGNFPDGFSSPEPLHAQLVSADELFVDGVILPLHLFPNPQQHQQQLSTRPRPLESHAPTPPLSQPGTSAPSAAAVDPVEPSLAAICSSGNPVGSSSKRWKDIFRGMAGVGIGEKKVEDVKEDKKRRRERRTGTSGSFGAGIGGAFAASAPAPAELNINIWPFSRSRSAGTSGAARHKGVAGAAVGRKVSSAPCSRSNSRGESSSKTVAAIATATAVGVPSASGSRRWATSPGRGGSAAAGGIHVGRASPVWQFRKGSGAKKGVALEGEGGSGSGSRRTSSGSKEKKSGGNNERAKAGSTCRDEEKNGVTDATAAGGSHHSAFNLRALFSRKVY